MERRIGRRGNELRISSEVIRTDRPVMEWHPREEEFWWYGRYELNYLPKQAGFRWAPEDRCWKTNKELSAVKLVEYADEEAKAKLLEEFG